MSEVCVKCGAAVVEIEGEACEPERRLAKIYGSFGSHHWSSVYVRHVCPREPAESGETKGEG